MHVFGQWGETQSAQREPRQTREVRKASVSKWIQTQDLPAVRQ